MQKYAIEAGVVDNLTAGDRYSFAPYPDFIAAICEQGGLFHYIPVRRPNGAPVFREPCRPG